jgi:diguanylate cyclase (GGDEF)-like protein/PAS domain S-box-containing protein
MHVTPLGVTVPMRPTGRHRRESELVRAAVDALPDSLVLWQPVRDDAGGVGDFSVAYVNDAACRLLGRPRDETIGRVVAELLPNSHRRGLGGRLRDVLLTGRAVEDEVRLDEPDAAGVFVEAIDVRRTSAGDVVAVTWRSVPDRGGGDTDRARLAAIVRCSDDAIVGQTAGGTITSWNRGAELLYGYDADEVLGQPILILVPPERADEIADMLIAIAHGERVDQVEAERVRKDGSHVSVSVTTSPILDEAGRVIGAADIARDITARKLAEAALSESEARFHAAFDDSPLGMALVTAPAEGAADGILLKVNRTLCYLLGVDRSAIEGGPIASWLHDEDRDGTLRALAKVRTGQLRHVELEARLVRAGEVRWTTIACSRIGPGRDADALCVLHVQDITTRKQAEAQLTQRALHDTLTGLANRLLLLDRLEAALARSHRTDRAVAVLFIDLDNFKVVNDSLGHECGDRLLIDIARRLHQVLRESDTPARLGGDEFLVLCDDIEHSEVLTIARRISAAIAEPYDVAGHTLHVTASVGIAVTSGRQRGSNRIQAEHLVRDADLAMYQAKRGGKNRYEVFDDALRARAVARMETEIELRTAIETGQLRVHYQPIVSLGTGRICGFEALVRWQHDERGLLTPADFLSVAEDSELIVPLGAYVLEQACLQLGRWHREVDATLTMAVNLSLRQLYRSDFASVLSGALQRTGVPPELLHLEITETVLMDATSSTMRQISALEAHGVRLAIDDFGTGYSSLLYLKRLPVREVKIDRSFVDGVTTDVEDRAIVEAIIRLAGALDLRVVAEGVENAEQLRVLRDLGCEQAQGHYLAAASGAEDASALLHRVPAW